MWTLLRKLFTKSEEDAKLDAEINDLKCQIMTQCDRLLAMCEKQRIVEEEAEKQRVAKNST